MTPIGLDYLGPEPVALAEAKSWARIERDDEDALIERLVTAARETVECHAGLTLRPRAFRIALEGVPGDRRVRPGGAPLTAVRSVLGFGRGGDAVALDAAQVRIEGGETMVLPVEFRMGAAGGLEIEYEAGMEAENVPEAVRIAILRMSAAAYETRGASDAMPPLAEALLAPLRRVRL
ncbi:head-tail connector protein [Aureimonas mangrovi]|uniref:head-tail connector protein n=1 Tax=Aureimonas mangrovi TaxID=2758041 RepID=UPI00163D95A0|nr:head-tail connector protein [Aureimonas mangrovi]